MAVIINKLETEQDVSDYKAWMATRSKGRLQAILRMIQTDEKYRPGRWYNVEKRIALLQEEIDKRM